MTMLEPSTVTVALPPKRAKALGSDADAVEPVDVGEVTVVV